MDPRAEDGRIRLSAGRIVITLAAVLLAAIAATFFRQAAEEPGDDRQIAALPRVLVAAVSVDSFDLEVQVVGKVLPWQEVSLAPEVGGRVQHVPVDIGDPVSEGQVVLNIDDDPYEDAVSERQAGLLRAQARLDESEAVLARSEALRAKGAMSEREYEAAVAMKRAGEADVRAAEAGLARALRQLADCQLLAPFAGTVVERFVDPGALVGPERPVLTLADLDTVAVEVGLTEQELLRVREARSARIESSNLPGKVAQGTVDGVANRSDPGTGTYRMRIRVENREQPPFLGGMVVQVRIPWTRLEQVIVVPAAAILDIDDAPRLFVLKGGSVREVTLEVLARVDERVAVRAIDPGVSAAAANDGDGTGEAGSATLGAGDQVVTAGQAALRDGDRVEVVGR